MANILTHPTNGAIYFDDGAAGSSTVPALTGDAVSLNYDGTAGLNITSYNTTSTDRFSIDGGSGRLFSVNDSLTGTIFSVNDAAGLPIIEVESTSTTDTITMGTYASNALVVAGDRVGIGTASPGSSYKLDVTGDVNINGDIVLGGALDFSGSIPAATSDTDTFLVVDSGELKTRTGAQVLSDIGGISSETVTTLALTSGSLVYTNESGTANSISLAAYLDEDSRSIASGSLNSTSGIVTFTRDDSTTFTLDLGPLLDDTNLVTSVAGKSGVVSLVKGDVGLGNVTNESKLTMFTAPTFTGGGNTVTLKKGTGNAALAFAGTSNEASALIEGIAGGGIKIYTSNGGTLSSPSWSTKMTIAAAGNTTFAGSVTATSLIKSGGSSSEFLKADGSVDSNTYLTTSSASSTYLPLAGGTMTGVLTLSQNNAIPLNITGANSSYTAIAVKNTGSGNAGVYYDAINGDLSGADYGFIGQEDAGYMLYDIGASSPAPYHVFSGGNVGIGITDPDQKLDVNGNIRIPNQGKIVFGSAGTATDYLQLHDVVAGNPLLKLVQDNVERFSIEGVTGNVYMQGNVGIGTTNPVEALNVGNNGNIRIDGNASGRGIFASSNGSNNTFSFTRQDGVNTADLSISGYGGVGLTGGRVTSPATSGYDLYVKNGGNVGIGTTSPSYKLHVSGTVGLTNQLYFTGTTADIQIGSSWGNGVLNFKNGVTTAIQFDVANNRIRNNLGKYLTDSSNIGQFGTLDNQSVAIVANNSEKMRITTGGSVGIGTTSPENKLHILTSTTDTSSQLMVQNGSSGDAAIKFNISGQSYAIGIDNSDANKFKISGHAALGTYDRLTIDTSGNVTIANSATISGDLTVSTDFEAGAAVNFSALANAGSDVDKFLVSDSGDVKFRTGAEVLSDIGGITDVGGKITKKISGDGTATTFAVTHSFGTPHVMTQLLHYGNNGTGATYEVINATVKRNSDNAIDVIFGVAPTTSEDYLVLITKMPAIS